MKELISSRFIEKFEKNIKNTIKKFQLLDKDEKILVAVSGGKDSTTILYILKKLNYDIKALTIDVSIGKYTKENLKNIQEFCKQNNIKLHTFSFKKEFGHNLSEIQSILKSKKLNLNSCTICGVLRRYLINKHAKKLNTNKLVTGHNMDDEAQSFMMNMFRHTLWLAARLGPKTGLQKSKQFIPRVKPLYLTSNKDVIKYSKAMIFPVKYGNCPYSTQSYRRFIKEMLNDWEKNNPKIKQNIINYFLKILPKLKQKFKAGSINKCEKCQEPSSKKLCKTCQILSKL